MPKAKLNGIDLYYEDEGQGQPIVLLHGLTGSHLMLRAEQARFQSEYRVVALDARGHGKSDKPESYTLNDHIEDVLALINYLKLDNVVLLGMSMGTYVAQGVAIQAPEKVDKIILVSGAAHGDTSSTEGLMARHADELEGLTFEEQMGEMAPHIFHDLDAVGAWLADMPSGLTAKQQEAAAAALSKYDFRPDLATVTVPVLVISGRHDGLNPPGQGKEIADHIPNAKFVVFENSGHAPNVEEPEAYFQLVDDFLKNG
ncbi:Haloacetate dehalogenase [Lentibacillus sp. JNUCC-1]|uniref:alpha/beta fold hydrolase n=1 Tax=Lentibacillus sp. JNUCC-1 TaxID=2654513 RepID=UPI0012E7662E|nr:alpha/beta hydrolase [Lentibacillus sp. JNUCC-1]MUV38260.1 Haloacetate dehalogenase [Lentibacillus sp. JNUCC-1]